MQLLTKYKHNYRGLIISGAAKVLSRVVSSLYLLFCCRLIYNLITEADQSQSAYVGLTEGDAPLLSDAVVICI